MAEISDQELLKLILEADEKALEEGRSPKQRSISVIPKVMEQLGYKGFVLAGVGTPPIVEQIAAIHRSLYRAADLAIGGLHGGIFMFRDIFVRIDVPIVFGKVTIDPFKFTDLSPMQLSWLGSRPLDAQMFLDQFADIFDFAGGVSNLGGYKAPSKEALEFFWLAAFQLQAAAATLSAAFDSRGAVQSAIIGAELALKGGLIAMGVDESTVRKHGHDLGSAANAYAKVAPAFNIDRVILAIGRMPPYVKNRYSPTQPTRIETGHIAMGAQYIAGEVMRQVTSYSIHSQLRQAGQRVYPQ